MNIKFFSPLSAKRMNSEPIRDTRESAGSSSMPAQGERRTPRNFCWGSCTSNLDRCTLNLDIWKFTEKNPPLWLDADVGQRWSTEMLSCRFSPQRQVVRGRTACHGNALSGLSFSVTILRREEKCEAEMTPSFFCICG